jgi:L-threonylcarbamoyladenylate synthase
MRLASAFWPGPLTLVVERAPGLAAGISGGGDSIAVRVPAHPIALALIAELGEPIAAPSANRYQGLSPTKASHVVKQLRDAVDLVLDGGPCAAGIESTVVDVRGPRARILRPGAADLAAIREIAPEIEIGPAGAAPEAARASPGMDARHYAPRARLVVAGSGAEAWETAARMSDDGTAVGLIVREKVQGPGGIEHRIRCRVLPADPAGFARALYATLHDLDDAGVAVIVVESVPGQDPWRAVADRLVRGSSG